MNKITKSKIESALETFRSQKELAEKAIHQINYEQLSKTLHPQTNCIAVIMKHLAGNMLSRWTDFLTTDGEKPWRKRDNEFINDFQSRDELTAYWNKGWNRLFDTLDQLTENDLAKIVTIRGENHSVLAAIDRQIAHYGYHVGQIVLIARIFADDHWSTLSIPRGHSEQFIQQTWKQ